MKRKMMMIVCLGLGISMMTGCAGKKDTSSGAVVSEVGPAGTSGDSKVTIIGETEMESGGNTYTGTDNGTSVSGPAGDKQALEPSSENVPQYDAQLEAELRAQGPQAEEGETDVMTVESPEAVEEGVTEAELPDMDQPVRTGMEEVESTADFEKLGIAMKIPQDVTEAAYYINKDTIAMADFLMNHIYYTCYASMSLSGEEMVDTQEVMEDTETMKFGQITVQLKEGVEGAQMAVWTQEQVNYCLYTTSSMGKDGIQAALLEILG